MQNFSLDDTAKDTSEELLWRIIDESPRLKNIGFIMLSEFLVAFKIPENNLMESEKIKKIKQKILDIVIDEKEESANYLTLPKFKNLSEGSKETLKRVMIEAWNVYQLKSAEEERNKKYSRYFFRHENSRCVEEFHLSIFQFLRNHYFLENPSMYRHMSGFPQMIPHMPGSEPFPNFPPMQLPSMPDPSYFGGTTIAPSNSHPPLSNIKMEQKDIPNYEHSYNYREEPSQKNSKKSVSHNEEQLSFKNTTREKEHSTLPVFKEFLSCVCKGKISENERYFECHECKKKYHLTCLNIPAYASEKIGNQKKCPQCSMKNTNSLYSVIGEPLETFWTDDRDLHKQKITIKSKKCKEIVEKKYSIQLKFLKVEGKHMYDWDNDQPVKEDHRSKKIKLNEIIIKDDVLNKGNGEDVKISLDSMKGPEEVKHEERKPILLFVTLNVIKKKTLQEVLDSTYEYFEEDYLDQFLKDKEEIKIELFDTKSKLFKKPVRGEDCCHSDLFDLEEFAAHCIDLHSDLCFCCSKRCKTFKIDRKLENEIAKIKEAYPDESIAPNIVYYQKNGTFRWGNPQEKRPDSPEHSPPFPAPFPDIDMSEEE